MTEPLISVYLPTHNRLELLVRAVQSVLAQTWTNFELVIVNDGSTDGTYEYLDGLAKQEDRIIVIHNEQALGACISRNLAIEKASGTLITGLDDDDEFLPNRLEALVKAYKPDYAFVCSGFLWDDGKSVRSVDSTCKIFTLSDQLDYNEATNQVLTETAKIREIGGFDPDMVACQDYDVWVRLMIKFGNAFRVGKPLQIIHRDHDLARISRPEQWLMGQSSFIAKHRSLLSQRNLVNQEFRALIVNGEKLGFICYLKMLKHGQIIRKSKYFIRSLFMDYMD